MFLTGCFGHGVVDGSELSTYKHLVAGFLLDLMNPRLHFAFKKSEKLLAFLQNVLSIGFVSFPTKHVNSPPAGELYASNLD